MILAEPAPLLACPQHIYSLPLHAPQLGHDGVDGTVAAARVNLYAASELTVAVRPAQEPGYPSYGPSNVTVTVDTDWPLAPQVGRKPTILPLSQHPQTVPLLLRFGSPNRDHLLH